MSQDVSRSRDTFLSVSVSLCQCLVSVSDLESFGKWSCLDRGMKKFWIWNSIQVFDTEATMVLTRCFQSPIPTILRCMKHFFNLHQFCCVFNSLEQFERIYWWKLIIIIFRTTIGIVVERQIIIGLLPNSRSSIFGFATHFLFLVITLYVAYFFFVCFFLSRPVANKG